MKRITLLIAVLFLTASAYGQVSVGPKGGVNFSKVIFGDFDEQWTEFDDPLHTGFNAGIGADFGINDNFSLYTELIWTQKGTEYEAAGVVNDPLVGSVNTRTETDVTLNYIELPLLLRLKVGGMAKFYLNAGPTVGYWINGSVDSHTDSQDFESEIEIKDRDEITGTETGTVLANEDVNRLEFGGAVGAGTFFDLQKGKINIDLRYGIGFTPFFENNEGNDDTWRNSVLSISLGYFFELGGATGPGYTRY